MPERATYDEAMLLAQARLKVLDPDLKQGKVERITLQTVAGVMERPWGIQGGFAVVYKFRTQSGKVRALRCFLVHMNPDTQFRYERIGAYFAAHAPDITVEFKYCNDGIILKETVYGKLESKTYPVIEMEWVEGATLVEHIDELCKKRDRAGLADVVKQWLAIVSTLRRASISHGDLAGVNVMVRPDGRLVLVDYDGVYIPDFAGLPQVVLGQVDYQHPQMHQRPFNERTDDFSALVIYTALLALQIRPELWDAFTPLGSRGAPLDTNLLFKQQDFLDPDRSRLFAELEKMSDTRIKAAVQALKHACQQSIMQVMLDLGLLDPDFDKRQALTQLEQAIQRDDDEEIVKSWVPALLDNYGPAQQYLARVAHARQVVQALKRFRDALQMGAMQQIVAAYDPILDNCKGVTYEQRELVVYAYDFVQAYHTDDDQAIVAAWEAIQSSRYQGKFTLTGQEQQRVELARQRKAALVKFRLAMMNKNIQQIVASYDALLLDTCTGVTPQERGLLQVAQDFVRAYQSDDDQDIAAATDEIENFSYRGQLNFTQQERQRIELARLRKTALVKFRLGLMSRNAQQMVANYDWILDDCKSVTAQERDMLHLAKNFVQAYHRDDDEAIAAAWEAIQQASYQKLFAFNSQDLQRIQAIQQYKTALVKFRLALASKSAQQIVASYNPVLDSSRTITHEERDLLRVARDFVNAYRGNDDQAIVSAWEEIQDPRRQQFFIFTEQERQRITLAQQRKVALVKFRLAVMNKNIQQILAAYDPQLDSCSNVTQDERNLLQVARDFVQACHSNNDQEIIAAWTAIQNSPYQKSFVFTSAEVQRIALAHARGIRQGELPHA